MVLALAAVLWDKPGHAAVGALGSTRKGSVSMLVFLHSVYLMGTFPAVLFVPRGLATVSLLQPKAG